MHTGTFALLAGAAMSTAPFQARLPEPAMATDVPRPERGAIRLSLEQALSLAAARSTAVERARRNFEIAALQVRNARAAYYPSASVTVSANQSAQGSAIRSDDFVYRQGVAGDFRGGVSLNASVPIDVSGIIRRQVRSRGSARIYPKKRCEILAPTRSRRCTLPI